VRRLLAGRLLQGAVIVVLVTTITFFLIHLVPGDPFASTLESPYLTEAHRARLRALYGLDRPVAEQFVRYVGAVARGDLGWSFSLRRPVADALLDALPNTLLLMGVSLVLSFALGIALGVWQGVRRGSAADRLLGGAALFFYSMPDFWLALMAMLVFAYWVPIFPVAGMTDPVMFPYLGFWGRIGDVLSHLALPALTLTLLTAAGVARYQRAAVLDVVRQDFVRTARAKGLPERLVVTRHLLRNALLPTITLLGLSVPALFGGAVFVERVFAWPGMGLLAVNAIATRDYPLVTASVIVASATVVAGSILADLLYAVADPRLRGR
jgi:peptide/nickel transport system permease protein